MKLQSQTILTINGGSSSIKFALYEAADKLEQILLGQIQRVGQPGTSISAKGLGDEVKNEPIQAHDQAAAAEHLIVWLQKRMGNRELAAISHRVVHGGLHLVDHQIIDEAVMAKLREAQELDPAHLPREIALIEAFGRRFEGVPQVACFDTAFFKGLPKLAKLLPIPRKYFDAGIHRFGFHGLSCTYLMKELERVAGGEAARGKVILAHLGSGASMAAVRNGQPIDTTMSFTPTAGLMMGTRSGDVDPGLLVYLLRSEKLSADQLDDLLNKESGLRGVSGTSADMRDLTQKQANDSNAADAVGLFCYLAKKWIGSFSAALGGIDTIVFAGGIGEHSPEARAAICSGLNFLGVELDEQRNVGNAEVISLGRVQVRVIATDEESILSQTASEILSVR